MQEPRRVRPPRWACFLGLFCFVALTLTLIVLGLLSGGRAIVAEEQFGADPALWRTVIARAESHVHALTHSSSVDRAVCQVLPPPPPPPLVGSSYPVPPCPRTSSPFSSTR